jgi:hypothetical protein
MGILNVLSDPVHAGTVYIGTDKQGIHKSTDCGATWVKVNTGRNGAAMDSGQQWSMAIDPVEPNVIFSGALYGTDLGLLKSTNGGVDWDSVFPPGGEVANMVDYTFLQEVSMDPTDHKHLVVSFHANCKGAYAPMCLAETKDSGATWRLLKGPLGSWAEASRPLVIGATSWLFATMMDGLFYTKDSGATWEKVGQAGGHQLYRASDGTYYLGGYVGVQRSPDGHAWSTVQGTPGWADAIIGDGSRIFVSGKVSDNHPFFTSPENDGKNWTKVTAATLSGGADVFAYDADHHVIYASAPSVGVVRAVTK